MALSRPLVPITIVPFTAIDNYDFTFSYTGNQISQNNLIIEKVSDGTEIYNQTKQSFQLKHEILANSLVNGVQYRAKLKVGDINNTWSDYSDYCVFKCLSSPTVSITNLVTGKVSANTYEFIGSYSQAEGELLKSYRFLLYDENSNLLYASIEKFDGLLKHEFAGLQNKKFYKIEMKVITQNGIEKSTGLIDFFVEYISPKLASTIELENMTEQGAIRVNGKLIQIIGQLGGGTFSYENDDWINLKNGVIYYDTEHGFQIENDFTLQIWGKDFIEGETLIKLYGTNGGIIEVKYQDGKAKVYKTLGTITYYIFSSETISPTSNDKIYIFVQKIKELMNVAIAIDN